MGAVSSCALSHVRFFGALLGVERSCARGRAHSDNWRVVLVWGRILAFLCYYPVIESGDDLFAGLDD